MRFFKNLAKCGIDFTEIVVLGQVIDTEFWQELIISIVVILFNFIVIPLFKSIFKKLKEKKGLDLPDIPDVDKEDFKEKEEK